MLRFGGIGDSRVGWIVIRSVLAEGILPVPPQVGHAREPSRPEPRHSGQIFSPLPGVPGRASSPGLSLALLLSDELCSRAMAVSPRSLRTPTPNRRAEFPLLRQSNGPGVPPRGRPDLVPPDKPTRPGASERRWPREGFTGPCPLLERDEFTIVRTRRGRSSVSTRVG